MTETDKVHTIFNLVCTFKRIPIEKANIKTRKREIVECRQIASSLSRELTEAILVDIGQIIGGKDHATVLHAEKTVNNLCETDQKFKKEYDTIKSKIVKHFNLLKLYGIHTPLVDIINVINRSARIRNKLKIYAKQGI